MWNQDISAAPRNSDIWLATKCGKVIKSYWIDKFGPGRWAGLGTKEQPVAWQAFVVPAHPGIDEPSPSGFFVASVLPILDDVGGE